MIFALEGLMVMRILSSGPVCFITARQTEIIWTGSVQTEKTIRFIVYFLGRSLRGGLIRTKYGYYHVILVLTTYIIISYDYGRFNILYIIYICVSKLIRKLFCPD